MPIKSNAQTKIEQNVEIKTDKLIYQSTNPLIPYYSTTYTPIYVTDNSNVEYVCKNPLKLGIKKHFDAEIIAECQANFPLFFENINTIYIPKKVETHLKRSVPNSILKRIDANLDIAVEKSILIASGLSSTFYSDERWKELSSKIMDEQTRKGNDNTRIYPIIIEALKYSTNTTEGIIKVKTNEYGIETYQEGVACKSYCISDTFFKGNLVKYVIKDIEILEKRKRFFYNQLKKAIDNPIANNLIGLYSKIKLPSYDEILYAAKKLTLSKHKNKKGKTLTFLNKHPKSYFKDSTTRCFVEENIKLFDYLTQQGFMIPIIGNEKSGGRVVDSFTLMPSWIRKLVKIDGESIVEVDYKALHPNIAMSLYRGSKKYLTHKLVAEESNIDLSVVKTLHLSFFNETLRGMKASKLYNYYKSSEPQMLKKIEEEKWGSIKNHKITSMRMFAKEVEIMTNSISELNSMGICVGYVYDALFCKKSDAQIVKEIMDKVALENNVFTTSCINY